MTSEKSSSKMTECFLAIDLGGTWIKGIAAPAPSRLASTFSPEISRIRNPSQECQSAAEFVETLLPFLR